MNGKSLSAPTKKKAGKLQRQTKPTKKYETPKKELEISSLKKRHKIFYDELPGLLRTIDTDGNIIDCNSEYANTFGYSKKELIGKSVFSFVADEGRQAFQDSFDTWLKTGRVKNKPVWFKKKDGTKFLGLVSASNLYDENGKMIGSNTLIKDITEIHETKSKLEESQQKLQDQVRQLEKANTLLVDAEQKYENLYNKTPTLLRTITIDDILTDCNDSYAKALGYTKEEAIGASIFDHAAERSMKDMRDNFERWKENHETEPAEIWLKRKDGSVFPSMLSGTSLYDERGKLIGRTLALTDMTEIYEARNKLAVHEKHLQQQLAQLQKSNDLLTITEKRYRTLYEKTPVLLRTITTEGILTDCNEAYARALGYTKEEAIGMSFYDHTAKSSVEDLKNNLEQWKKTNEVPLKEIWMKRKDGSIFPSLLSGASIFDEYGNVIGRTVALTDMTEIYEARRQLEEKEARIREQYDELKKIDTSKEEFTSMISHELKTPLTPIMGWCQALKSPKILGELSSKQLQALDAIETNAIKLKELVSDMLDAQKLDMKRMKFDNKDVDVTEMMNFLAQNLQSTMVPKHIEFVNSTTEKLTLKSDRSRLEQVLNNIILNAVDFTSAQTGKIEIRAESKDSAVLFMVKDNGIGIPKDKQSHLFTQFYQLDTSATRKHGGSGLGLSICKGIVEALGGEIWVESDTGKGSDFYFTIPKQKKIQLTVEEKTNF
ncbi:MAG: PAS domain-containing sensor histidine kinase [Thaumarchaeota archaeon]|nr:MAG: PAS domain-containing sensor histidine kinase [Nitrososphaerota archaeon]